MALTVSTDLTNITTAETFTGWNDIGGGSGGAVEPDFFVQGSNCVSRAVSGSGASRGMTFDIGSGNELDFSSGGAEEDMLVYMWLQVSTPALTDNVANEPGLTIRFAEDANEGNNFAEWDVVYSDLLTPAGTEAFRLYVIDPRCPPTRTTGTWDYNNVRHFGAVLDTNATAKGRNLSIDRISYGFGELRVNGTADNEASGFQEIIDWDWGDINQRWGIVQERTGIAFIKGKLVIGDSSGTAATTFTGQDNIFVWEDTFCRDSNGIVRSTVGYDDSQNWTGRKSDGSAYYGLEIVGNGTGDTDATFGAIVGTDQGRSGPTFIGSDLTPTEFSFDDGAVEDVLIYGTTFDKIRELDFDSNASTDQLFGCTFKRCGALDIGPVDGRNNNFIACIGGGYTFYETFANPEATAAEQLSTANPTTEWTDLLNGAEWSVPAADSRYVELTDANTRTNITHLDDDKMGSDDHYCEAIVNFPSGGSSQATLGLCIALDSAAQDYFYMEVDLVNDQVELFRVNTGTDTSIDGPTTFTMDEDEDYVVLLRRSGTTIEGFISGNSAADGIHTTKLSAMDSAHTGTSHRLVGLRGDANTAQSGDAPRVSDFGAGPITDNLGAIILPTTGNWDFEDANFINCVRALSWDNTGTYTLTNITLSGNLVDTHNDSGGSITGSFVGAAVPSNTENLGASTSTFTADVTVLINVKDTDGTNQENARVYVRAADGAGPLPFEESVTITRSGTTATVSHTGHGLVTNDKVKILGITDKTEDNNGVHQITVSDANTYTYTTTDSGSTNYTGTITSTGVILEGNTDASGNISRSRTFSSNQNIAGVVRKSTTSPRFKTFDLTGNTVSSTSGLTLNVRLISDE